MCPQAKRPISVVIAESNGMTGSLLGSLLKKHSGFAVSAVVGNRDSLLRVASSRQTDIALVSEDLEDGPGSGLAALSALQIVDSGLRSVVLLDRSKPQVVMAAVRGGARGIFLRSHFDPAALFKCIQRVYEGQLWLTTAQMDCIVKAVTLLPQIMVVNSEGVQLLTAREEEVVRLVAEGLGNNEIAKAMKLSDHTVKNYLFRIYDKLGISNRVELVLYALANAGKGASEEILEGGSIPLQQPGTTPERKAV